MLLVVLIGLLAAARCANPLAQGERRHYQCLFHQRLEPRRAYMISSPGYPARYRPGESCQWVATATDSKARVVLDCDTFDLPPPKGGECGDALWVSLSGRRLNVDGEPRCGSGRFTLVSYGPRLNLKLVSQGAGKSGIFSCSVAATDEWDEWD